jgi:hypothetical protein
MSTILVVVLSVLATLSVVFLMWTVDGLRKAHKSNEKSQEQITSLYHSHDDVHRKIDKAIDVLSGNLTNAESALQNDIRRHIEDISIDSNQRMDDINRQIEELEKECFSEMDRRLDKLYSKLYREFPQLNDNNKTEQINS